MLGSSDRKEIRLEFTNRAGLSSQIEEACLNRVIDNDPVAGVKPPPFRFQGRAPARGRHAMQEEDIVACSANEPNLRQSGCTSTKPEILGHDRYARSQTRSARVPGPPTRLSSFVRVTRRPSSFTMRRCALPTHFGSLAISVWCTTPSPSIVYGPQ